MKKLIVMCILLFVAACGTSNNPNSDVTDMDNFLHGTIIDDNGAAVVDATVYLYKAEVVTAKRFDNLIDTMIPIDSTKTDKNGVFKFTLNIESYYSIIAYKNNLPISYHDIFYYELNMEIEMKIFNVNDALNNDSLSTDSTFQDSTLTDSVTIDTTVSDTSEIDTTIIDSTEFDTTITSPSITFTEYVLDNKSLVSSRTGEYFYINTKQIDQIFSDDSLWIDTVRTITGVHIYNYRTKKDDLCIIWRTIDLDSVVCNGRYADVSKTSTSDWYIGDSIDITTITPTQVVVAEEYPFDTVNFIYYLRKADVPNFTESGIFILRNSRTRYGLTCKMEFDTDTNFIKCSPEFGAPTGKEPWKADDVLQVFM